MSKRRTPSQRSGKRTPPNDVRSGSPLSKPRASKPYPSPSKRDVMPETNGAILPPGHGRDVGRQAGALQLAICVCGIYASFLSWALLQERITTTTYGPPDAPETFNFAIVLNTIQSAFAALLGYVYLYLSSSSSSPYSSSSATTSRKTRTMAPIFPNRAILPPILLVAITSSLASPFGYAALKHIDYITFVLAKACKLLPVLALHVTLFRRRYPLWKYAVVGTVTAGVVIFTLYHPSTISKAASKAAKRAAESSSSDGKDDGTLGQDGSSSTTTTAASHMPRSSSWGLFLLSVNLLFDGLTNTTQDHIFARFRPYSGPQMMCAQNVVCTALTVTYLLLSPYLAQTALADSLGFIDAAAAAVPASRSLWAGGELTEAIAFVGRYPAVGWDMLAFSVCGAVGQVFIFYTLAHFSSLILVTVTVTRKMLTMLLSVLWFGHRLNGHQWLGVGLVFGGVGAEAVIQRREKGQKARQTQVSSNSASLQNSRSSPNPRFSVRADKRGGVELADRRS